MIQADLGSLILIQINRKEHSLNQENILSHLAKSDGNIRILMATIAYEMRVYSQAVKVIIHYSPS